MRQARVWVVALAAAALLALAGACANNTTQTGSAGYQRKTKKAGEPVYIGFSMDTLKEERWQRDKALVEARAKEVGARAIALRPLRLLQRSLRLSKIHLNAKDVGGLAKAAKAQSSEGRKGAKR